MKKIFIKTVSIAISLFVICIPLMTFAQITNPLKVNNIPDIISSVLGYVVKIGGVVAIFAFIYSGFLFVQAQGSETGLKKAKDTFFGTVIGVAVLLGAQLIASIIVGTLKSLK